LIVHADSNVSLAPADRGLFMQRAAGAQQQPDQNDGQL
jgi:hypothetical protein